ncbi:Zinc finger MYM-type protein 1, partial [Caligus rogercresseyi]
MSQKRMSSFFQSLPKNKLLKNSNPQPNALDQEYYQALERQDKVAAAADVIPVSTAASPSQDTEESVVETGTSPLPSEPFQPQALDFPAKQFGTETFTRSFKSAWFGKWKWLHYLKDVDKALCYICVSAVEKSLIQEEKKRADAVFIRGGFSNWRKATNKFREHERSTFHLGAVNKVAALNNTPISALLSDVVAKDQKTARVVLNEAFKSVRYLLRQGLPLRGHDYWDGNFWLMMLDRTESLPEARQWMLRRDNWLSDTIQNEMIEQLAHAVQRKLVQEANCSSYFGLTADGTTDISSSEQFSCHLHYVNSQMGKQSVFLGFYSAPDSTADSLFRCIVDIFLRLNLPIEKLQGYCFDGASNMAGRISGVRTRLAELCPGSLFVHCCNHSLDLALQEVARDVSLIAEIFNFVQS